MLHATLLFSVDYTLEHLILPYEIFRGSLFAMKSAVLCI